MTIEDGDSDIAVEELRQNEFDTSPSGGAGYAAIKEAKKYPECKIDKNSKILIILTEKPA